MTRHNTRYSALKRTRFMAAIDGVFCLDARMIAYSIYKRETLSVALLEWSECNYNTPDTVERITCSIACRLLTWTLFDTLSSVHVFAVWIVSCYMQFTTVDRHRWTLRNAATVVHEILARLQARVMTKLIWGQEIQCTFGVLVTHSKPQIQFYKSHPCRPTSTNSKTTQKQ